MSQATNSRGRTVEKVRYSLVELVLDVPQDSDLLLTWANDPAKRLPASAVFANADGGTALETLALAGAYCVGYREEFAAGDEQDGAYRCLLTLADPDGFTMRAGGPSAVSTTPQVAWLGNPFGLPNVLPVLAPLLVPTAEELLAVASSALIATAATAAAAIALPVTLTLGLILLSTTPAQAPGIPQTAYPPLSPDAARLNELEEARKARALTESEEQ